VPPLIEFRVFFVQIAEDLPDADLLLLETIPEPEQFLDGNAAAEHRLEDTALPFLDPFGERDLLLPSQKRSCSGKAKVGSYGIVRMWNAILIIFSL